MCHIVVTLDNGNSDRRVWVWHSSSWLSDWRIVYNSYVLKYESDNLIIFYCCTYSRWLVL